MLLGGYLISPFLQFDGVVSPDPPAGPVDVQDCGSERATAQSPVLPPNQALCTIGTAPGAKDGDDVDLDADDPGHGRRTRRRRGRGRRGESAARSRPPRRVPNLRETAADQEECSDTGPVVSDEVVGRVRDPRLRPKPKPAKKWNM